MTKSLPPVPSNEDKSTGFTLNKEIVNKVISTLIYIGFAWMLSTVIQAKEDIAVLKTTQAALTTNLNDRISSINEKVGEIRMDIREMKNMRNPPRN